MNKRPVIVAIGSVVSALYYFSAYNNSSIAQVQIDKHTKWIEDENLALPIKYREWVYFGSPITNIAFNNSKIGIQEHYKVYLHWATYKIYKKANEFPEGTSLLREFQLTKRAEEDHGSRKEVSGRGSFPAAFNGTDIAVKVSKRKAESQNWDYFNFGHHALQYAKTAKAAPIEACAAYHIGNTTKDMVFSKFYTILNT